MLLCCGLKFLRAQVLRAVKSKGLHAWCSLSGLGDLGVSLTHARFLAAHKHFQAFTCPMALQRETLYRSKDSPTIRPASFMSQKLACDFSGGTTCCLSHLSLADWVKTNMPLSQASWPDWFSDSFWKGGQMHSRDPGLYH